MPSFTTAHRHSWTSHRWPHNSKATSWRCSTAASELGNPRWGEAQYAEVHIPGAQFLHLDRDLSSPITATSGRHPLPDPRVFARRLGALGAGTGMQIVAYDQGNGAYAARLWWLARWIGHAQVAVLDGGLAAWRAAGLPLETTVRTPQPRSLEVRLDERAAVDSRSVDELRQRPDTLLVDARGANRFAGRDETIDQRAGHIPGARNLPFTGNLGGDGKFLPADNAAPAMAGAAGFKAASGVDRHVRLWRHRLSQPAGARTRRIRRWTSVCRIVE